MEMDGTQMNAGKRRSKTSVGGRTGNFAAFVLVLALIWPWAGGPLQAQKAAQRAPAPAAAKAAPAAKAAGGAREWKQLRYPPLRDLKLPEIKRYTLGNGIRLFVVEDHRLPLVDGFAIIRTGSRWEPAEKVGLASITGQVMRSGGTRTKTGDQIDEELEAIAASVETNIGLTSGSASFSALKGDEDRVLAAFADVLMNPEFRQDKIELAKTFARTAISRRNDDAMAISSREFRKLLYGPQSPYARHTEYAALDAVTRDDLIAFHRRYYHPANVMIGISGDVNAEEVRRKVERAFAAWKTAPLADGLPPAPAVSTTRGVAVNFIRKEDVNQTSIRIGHLGGRRNDPDYFALEVMAQILASGGFSSRITKHIRTEMGLAYAAGGDWNAEYDYPGTFSVFVGTKSESTVQAIEAVMKELRDIRQKEVTDEELKIAKESTLNSFVFNFTSPEQVLRRIMTYIYYGYPEDFLQQYKTNVEKVAKADVLRVAQKHLEPEQVTILVVGNDKEFDKPLTQVALAAGKVNTLDITIPEAKPAAAAAPGPAPPAALERGRAVLAAAQKAAGGLERLRAIKDISMVMERKVTMQQNEIAGTGRDVFILPNVIRSEQTLPFGTIISFYDGKTGWMQTPQGTRDLPDAMKKMVHGQLVRNTLNLLRAEGGYAVQFEKREKVGDADADVVVLSKDGETVRLFVDASSGNLLKKTYRGQFFAGAPADLEEIFSDYREVSGVRVPFRTIVNQNGEKFLDSTVSEVKLNSGADPAELAKKPQ